MNELITLPSNSDNTPAISSTAAISSVMSGGGWLGRIQLYSAKSKEVMRKVIPADHYGYTVDQKTVDLGESVDVLVVAYRTKAMEFNQADNTVFTVFDPKLDEKGQPTGEFKRIMDKSELADSGCMFGLEYLVWLPQLEKFATLFMGTKSNRRTAPQLNDRLLKGATLKSKLIETKKYTWTAIDVFECSQISPMPTEAEVTEQYNKFINPKEASTETIEEEATNSSGEGRSY